MFFCEGRICEVWTEEAEGSFAEPSQLWSAVTAVHRNLIGYSALLHAEVQPTLYLAFSSI